MRHLVLLVFISCISTQSAATTDTTSNQSLIRNVSYSSVLELPTSQPAAKISYGADPLQFGLLWLPDKPITDGKLPVVVFIHGGCWLNAFDIEHSRPLTTALSKQGFAVWSIEYRRTGDSGGGWPGSFEDILKATEHLKKLSHHPLDLTRVALIGHSAGGHLALLAATQTNSVPITKVIGLAAISDVAAYAAGGNSCQQATPGFMGGVAHEIPEQYKAASPLEKAFNSEVLLLHGSEDKIVPAQHSRINNVRWVQIQGAGHFDWIHPDTEAFDVLLRELTQLL